MISNVKCTFQQMLCDVTVTSVVSNDGLNM